MADLTGNVIAVGSVSELADILANMTPEQLKNVTLDPALYEALSETIEPQQQQNSSTVQNSFETVGQDGLTAASSQFALNEPLNEPITQQSAISDMDHLISSAINTPAISNNEILHANTLLNINPNLTVGPDISTVVSSNIQLTDFNVINNDIGFVNTLPQAATIPLPDDSLITPRTPILENAQATPQPSSFHQDVNHAMIAPNISYGITNSNVQISNNEPVLVANVTIPPQTFPDAGNTTNPMVISSVLNIPTCVQIVQTTPAQVVNQSTIQGILPGEAGSLIITPTIMSQVQPTASIQALHLPNTTIIPNTSTVTISSNPSNFSANANLIINPVTNSQVITALQNVTSLQNTNNVVQNTVNIEPFVNAVNINNQPSATSANFLTQPVVNAAMVAPPMSVNIQETSNLIQTPMTIAHLSQQPVNANINTSPSINTVTDPSILSDTGAIIANIMPNEIPLQQLIDAGLITIDQVASLIQGNILPESTKIKSPVKNSATVKTNALPTKPAVSNKPLAFSIQQQRKRATPSNTSISNSITNKSSTADRNRVVPSFLKEKEDSSAKNADRIVQINIPEKFIDKSQTVTSQVKVVNNVGIITTPDAKKVSVKPKSIEQVQPGVFKVTLAKLEKTDTVQKPPVFVNTIPKSSKNDTINVQKPSVVVKHILPSVGKQTSTHVTPNSLVKMTSNVSSTRNSPNVIRTIHTATNKLHCKDSRSNTNTPNPPIAKTIPSSFKSAQLLTGSTSIATPVRLNPPLQSHKNVDQIIRSSDKKRVYVVKKISTNEKIPKGAIVLPKGVDIEAFQKKLDTMGGENIDFFVSEASKVAKDRYPSSSKMKSPPVRSPTNEMNLECRERTLTSPPTVSDDKPTKLTYSRSFKKTTQTIPKTKDEEKKLSKEETELLNIQKAIKSSNVGEGEKNMRNLAKLELEKQLKRFAQKLQPSIEKQKVIEAKTKSKEAKPLKTSSDLKRKKVENNANMNQKKSRPVKNIDDVKEEDSEDILSESESKPGIESGRKRTHPRKYEDFILPKSKKRKKIEKKKKFFFPAADETEQSDSQTSDTTDAKSGNDTYLEMGKSDTVENVVSSAKNVAEEDSMSEPRETNDPKSNEEETLVADKETNPQTDSQQAESTDVKIEEKVESESDDETENINETDTKNEKGVPTNTASTNQTKNVNRKRKKKKQQNKVTFEPETLPAHLKAKPKAKAEDMVIDLSKVKLKTTFTEVSFRLDDVISYKTYKHLRRGSNACTLCNKPGRIGTLDLLFGAYKVKVQRKSEISEGDEKENEVDDDIIMDVWFHRDCAIWTSTISLGNQTLLGVGDALEAGGKTKCCSCNQYGATLECCVKQCRDGYHFVCAKQRGCTFMLENFTITCPKHKI